jgi:hypothetical protein
VPWLSASTSVYPENEQTVLLISLGKECKVLMISQKKVCTVLQIRQEKVYCTAIQSVDSPSNQPEKDVDRTDHQSGEKSCVQYHLSARELCVFTVLLISQVKDGGTAYVTNKKKMSTVR